MKCDIKPTEEQWKAVYSINDDCDPALTDTCSAIRVAQLIAEREEALRAVICRLRSILAEVVRDDYSSGYIMGGTLNDAEEALRETQKYEVGE